MDLVQTELTTTSDVIQACRSRVTDAFASQSASRECIRLTHIAIAQSRTQIDRPFESPIR